MISSPGMSINRGDNNKGYYKENCRWATRLEQANNRRPNVRITHNGITRTMMQCSRLTGIDYAVLNARHRKYQIPPMLFSGVIKPRNTKLTSM